MLAFVSLILISTVCCMEAFNSKVCFEAKTCFHSGKEKCGVDVHGERRRFIDQCDMLEYNCLKKTDFSLVLPEKCSDLPPIPPDRETLNIHKNPAVFTAPFNR